MLEIDEGDIGGSAILLRHGHLDEIAGGEKELPIQTPRARVICARCGVTGRT